MDVHLHSVSFSDVNARVFDPPTTTLEKYIQDAWQHELKIDSVGVCENFFALGGDSMNILGIIVTLRKRGIKVFPKWFYQYQTIRLLSPIAITENSRDVDWKVCA